MSPIACSYLTLAGTPHGGYPRYSPIERAKAAHAVGIPGMGILWDEEITPDILKYTDIVEAEWFELSHPISPQMSARLAVLAEVYGVTTIKTGLCASGFRVDWAATNLARLVHVAESRNLTVAVEPVAWGSTPTLQNTLSMMTQAGVISHPNVGICYDLWQVMMRTPWDEGIGATRLPRIAKVEVCGIGNTPGDMLTLAMDRPLLADSKVNVKEWTRRIMESFDVPVTYEVPSARLRMLSLMQTAEIVARDMEML